MVDHLDHLVLTVTDIDATCAFYTEVLGMKEIVFGSERRALTFGNQKINLHERGREFEPKASCPTPGAADLCFITSVPLEQVMVHIRAHKVDILEGPVERTGAVGPIVSVYIRDPDGDIIEVSNRIETA